VYFGHARERGDSGGDAARASGSCRHCCNRVLFGAKLGHGAEILLLPESLMTKWLRRVRGAVGMGLTWGVGWALAGLLIGVSSVILPALPWEYFFEVFDAPLPALAIPGFFGGAIFSAVLGIAGRRRRFDELSVPRFAALGAVGGLLLSVLPAAMVAVGLASVEGSRVGLWRATLVISGPFILLSAASAAVSLMLARRAERREPAQRDAGAAESELAGGGMPELGAGRDASRHGDGATRAESGVRSVERSQ
jgi:hypothetical protein